MPDGIFFSPSEHIWIRRLPSPHLLVILAGVDRGHELADVVHAPVGGGGGGGGGGAAASGRRLLRGRGRRQVQGRRGGGGGGGLLLLLLLFSRRLWRRPEVGEGEEVWVEEGAQVREEGGGGGGGGGGEREERRDRVLSAKRATTTTTKKVLHMSVFFVVFDLSHFSCSSLFWYFCAILFIRLL